MKDGLNAVLFILKGEMIMLQAYSLNVTVPANTSVPFNNVTLEKGCTATLQSVNTIQLNKCGVYCVNVDASAATASTIQLFKDGVALPQAQSTGTAPNFTCLVQVDKNNSCCPCSSPVTLQVMNPTTDSETFTNVNVVVNKLC